jgi:Putative DNA-binding domain
MHDPAAFQHSFGAALAGMRNDWLSDPAMARALTIHRNTSARAAQDALRDNFPVTAALVGEEAFSACAAAFVEAHPPVDPRLCVFGTGFDRFLAAYRPFGELVYLPDIAALERLCTEALFAADATSFDGSSFDLHCPLPLHPATRLGRFASPAVAIWQAHQPDAVPDAISTIDWEDSIALVTRPGRLVVTALDNPTAVFVEQCKFNALLGDAATSAVDCGGDLSAIFAALILCGAFQNQATEGEL